MEKGRVTAATVTPTSCLEPDPHPSPRGTDPMSAILADPAPRVEAPPAARYAVALDKTVVARSSAQPHFLAWYPRTGAVWMDEQRRPIWTGLSEALFHAVTSELFGETWAQRGSAKVTPRN